jgi:inorganic pyrophosphatase
MLPMRDEAGADEKIVAVCVDDPEFAGYDELAALPAHRQGERMLILPA